VATAEATLAARSIRKSYGPNEALRGVDLDVQPGQILVLLGPNGAGKTTLVSIVAGLIRPDSGSLLVKGIDVAKKPARARSHIGMAAQDTAVYPTVSVRQNLQLFGRIGGLWGAPLDRRVDQLAEVLGLTDFLDRKARFMSGGEKRRLHAALALINEPALLLLDEPTTGADPGTRTNMLHYISELAGAALALGGYAHANGSEQVVPGMAVLSAFFIPSFIGLAFFKEHGWNTWERLQTTSLRKWEIIVGKLAPWAVIGLIHQVAVFAVGYAVFGLRTRGSWFAIAVLIVFLVTFLLSFGLFLVTVSRTIQQVSAYGTLGSVLLAGLGGALTPVRDLPPWVQHIAPVAPTYWAMRGFRAVILDGRGVSAVLLPCAVLAGAAALCLLVAASRFRFDDAKLSWTT
jgi:ABC-2 type transport system permease protein